eukprot:1193051-Prorocentrum_minimum.AAC.4
MQVYIDHRAAHIYATECKGDPPAATVTPSDLRGFRRHLRSKHHYKRVGSVWRGDWAPEDLNFYQV